MVLAIILGCYLMVVLDASVVITALPDIRLDLGFSPAGLSWVQNIYALAFGGLLLLGARMGDLLGRRQVFIGGITLFTVASMLGGLAQSETWLLAARALQGVGAAIAAPSTLALLTVSFPEGSERTRAIALYSRRRQRRRLDRPRPRRHADQLDLLALEPLHQRPDRRRPRLPGARATCRRPSATRASSTSPARPPRRSA